MKTMFALALVALMAAGASAAAAPVTYPTVADAIAATPSLSLLAANLNSSSTLSAKFANPDTVATIFAPTNAALQYLAAQAGQANPCKPNISAVGPDVLNQMLENHIINGEALNSTALKNGAKLTSELGEPLLITRNASMTTIGTNTSTAKIGTANILAGNAIIHTINQVLVPADLASLVLPQPDPLTGEVPPAVAVPDCPAVTAAANATDDSMAPMPSDATPAMSPSTGAPTPATPSPKPSGAAAVAASGAFAALAAAAALLL